MKRGEVWWANLDPAKGSEIRKRRPAVILTVNPVNRARKTCVVVPLSTGPAPAPPLVISTPSAGANSVAVCDQLRAVDHSRLEKKAGDLSAADLAALEAGMRIILGL